MRHMPLAEPASHRWPLGLPSAFSAMVLLSGWYSGSQMPSFGSVVPEPYRLPTFWEAGGGGLAGAPGAPITSAGAPAGMTHILPLKALAPAEGSSPRNMRPS